MGTLTGCRSENLRLKNGSLFCAEKKSQRKTGFAFGTACMLRFPVREPRKPSELRWICGGSQVATPLRGEEQRYLFERLSFDARRKGKPRLNGARRGFNNASRARSQSRPDIFMAKIVAQNVATPLRRRMPGAAVDAVPFTVFCGQEAVSIPSLPRSDDFAVKPSSVFNPGNF